MVDVKAITNLLTLGAGVYIFTQVFPLIQDFLKGGAGLVLPSPALPSAGPSTFEQVLGYERAQAVETRAAHATLREQLQEGLSRALYAPGVTPEMIYGGVPAPAPVVGTAAGTLPGAAPPITFGILPPVVPVAAPVGAPISAPPGLTFLGIGRLPPAAPVAAPAAAPAWQTTQAFTGASEAQRAAAIAHPPPAGVDVAAALAAARPIPGKIPYRVLESGQVVYRAI